METLNQFVENRQRSKVIKEATAKMYLSVIKQFFKDFGGDFQSVDDIVKHINLLKGTTQHKMLSLLRVFLPNEQKITDLFEQSRITVATKPPKEIPEFDLKVLSEKIDKFEQLEYKLLYTVLINSPVLRPSDYFSLSIKKRGKTYNYIQANGKMDES